MTPSERKNLAEQLVGNPLFSEMLDSIESAAIEALVYAATEDARVEAQWRVRSARTFRDDCNELVRSTHQRKGAPA